MFLRRSGNLEQALVIYEQSLKNPFNAKFELKSIADIALIKLIQNDIYQCYQELKRIKTFGHLTAGLAWIKNLIRFVSAAISCRKLKFYESLDLLSSLFNTETG
jgi:hypothetical protein